LGLGLTPIATALSGCASMLVHATLGPDPRESPPAVVGYEWAGRRGDDLLVVYEAWGGRPRRVETRWTAIDLGAVAWAPGLAAPRIGDVGDRPGPVPDRGSLQRVLVTELRERRDGTAGQAPAWRASAGGESLSVYGRLGASAELIVVTTDRTGPERSASWALARPDDPGHAEPVPRTLGRAVAVPLAGAVDLVTAPLQLLLGAVGVLQLH
jgi:hypothetical protein